MGFSTKESAQLEKRVPASKVLEKTLINFMFTLKMDIFVEKYFMLIIVCRFSTEIAVNTSVMCSLWDQVLAQCWVSWL